MNRAGLRVFVGVVTVAVLGVSGAGAQPPVPGGSGGYQRPTVSPYLNLLRGGSPTLNYFGIVRPEVQFGQAIGGLQNSVTANQQAIGGLENEVEGVPITGHPTQFLNYGGYFGAYSLNRGFGRQSGSQTGSQSGFAGNRLTGTGTGFGNLPGVPGAARVLGGGVGVGAGAVRPPQKR